MSGADETLFTAAKLLEQMYDDLDGHLEHHDFAGVVDDPDDLRALAFYEEAVDGGLDGTEVGREVRRSFLAQRTNRAITEGNATALAHLVGVTETEYDGSALSVTAELIDRFDNDGAPSNWTFAGNPNSGKTNTVATLVEMADRAPLLEDDERYVVLSNVESWRRTDVVVKSMHDLMVALLRQRDEPKIVVIDEASTHFDARTKSYEVAEQWTPAVKRFAKIGVDAIFVIGHTGKDIHPEQKRLTTTAVWKQKKDVAEFYDEWDAEMDGPTSPVFADPVQGIEKYEGYDPDDAAPWNWDLRAGLFELDLDWSGLLEELLRQGPAED